MSKKMLKRSLALGALMAFVITGSAMAETLTIEDNTKYDTVAKDGSGWFNKNKIYNVNGEQSGNTVTIGSVNNVDARIYGGYVKTNSGNANADNNTLNINGNVGTEKNLVAGYVNQTDTNATEDVSITCNGNTMNITGSVTSSADILAAEAKSKTNVIASGNTINISGNVSSLEIIAASVAGGVKTEAIDNSVIVSGDAQITSNLYASCIGNSVAMAEGNTVNVANNKVTIKDNASVSGLIVAGYTGIADDTSGKNGTTTVIGNSVTLEGNASVGSVFGAYAVSQTLNSNNDITVSGNSVTINGDVVVNVPQGGNDNPITNPPGINGVCGAYVYSFSNSGSANATVEGNTVNVNGGTINADIYGAYAFAGNGTGDSENSVATSNNNTVNLKGGTINGNVYGGYSEMYVADYDGEGYDESQDGLEPASGNTISLQGDVDVSSAKLYGSNGGEGTGNKLEVDESYTGSGKVDTVGKFDEIVVDEMKYGEAALTVTNMEYKEATKDENGNTTGGTKITVNKMTMSGDQELGEGTQLQIINATDSNLDTDESGEESKGAISSDSSVTIYKGTSEIIEVGFGGEDGTTVKEENIKKTTCNDQVLVIGESRAAATAFVNQGSELVETGLDALARDNAKLGDTKVFAAVYGNASEYATGSHVKVNGWSGIVGVGKTNDNGLTVGAFFENGTGNYRTYNTVNNDFMRGDGEATYNGGGFLVRKDNANGVYTEASLRAGNLQNELRNAVRGSEGLAGYDVDTFYYGAHLGIGKIIPRGNEGDSIDVYGKFIYTHHDSEDFTIDGSDFHFDSVDSERLRLGFRINEVQTNKLSMYYGAAWEYEFNGDADNTTVGYDLSTPSLGGSTMIGEIGMHYNASEKWSLDLNVRGYSGQRDGFTGSVQANYAF